MIPVKSSRNLNPNPNPMLGARKVVPFLQIGSYFYLSLAAVTGKLPTPSEETSVDY